MGWGVEKLIGLIEVITEGTHSRKWAPLSQVPGF